MTPVDIEAVARDGCRLARQGELKAAKNVATQLRTALHDHHNTRLAVWMFVLDGLIAYFDGFQPQCRDRIQRALAVSRAGSCNDLAILCAAWLAHIDFNAERFADTVLSLKYCFRNRADADHEALARAHLVLADFSMLAERIDFARHHYELARRSAVAAGDQASIAAITFNRAVMSLNHLRIRHSLNQSFEGQVSVVALEVRSATLFHQAAGHTSLAHLLALMNARLALVSGAYERAVPLYRETLSLGQPLGLNEAQAVARMEFCSCLLALGEADESRRVFDSLSSLDASRLSVDDALLFAFDRHRALRAFDSPKQVYDAEQDYRIARAMYLHRVEQLSEEISQVELILKG